MNRAIDAEVELSFLVADRGGRVAPVMLRELQYRPHLQVGGGEFLGVACSGGPSDPVKPGQAAQCQVAFVYAPAVNYDKLQKGVVYSVMEGSKCVATGRVIRRLR